MSSIRKTRLVCLPEGVRDCAKTALVPMKPSMALAGATEQHGGQIVSLSGHDPVCIGSFGTLQHGLPP